MHERLNTFREFLRQPQAEAIDLVSWLEPAGAPEPIPVPNIAGIAPFAKGTPRATTPAARPAHRRGAARARLLGRDVAALSNARSCASEGRR